MVGQVQLAFLLVIAAFAHSDAAPVEQDIYTQLRSLVVNPLEHDVLLDNQFDQLLPRIQQFILDNGLDPMDAIDISDSLLPDLPGDLKGEVELTHGWVQNLSKVKRAGHVIAKYNSEKLLTLDMELGFDVLDFDYEYFVKYLLFERKGDMYCRMYDLKSKVVVKIDLQKYHATLDTLKFTEVGKLDLKFEGHILDGILNVLTKIVTTLFKNIVLEHVEQRAEQVIAAKIGEWDKLIPHPNSTEPNYKMRTYIDTFDIKMN